MQRCPYIHEMRERFINDTPNQVYIMNRMERERDRAERENLLGNPKQSSAISDASSNQVGTVVKVLLAKTTRATAWQQRQKIKQIILTQTKKNYEKNFQSISFCIWFPFSLPLFLFVHFV